MAAPAEAYIGVWHDYSNGVWTLTLPEKEAGILSAVLVIFIGFVASQAWGACKFFLHQARVANHRHEDGLYHQQQVAVRNSNGHLHATWLLVSLSIAWRSVLGTSQTIRRALPLLVLPLASLAVWSAVQLLLSYIWTTAGDQFRVANAVCGAFSPENPHLPAVEDRAQVWNVYYKNRLEEASTYATQCYGRDASAALCSRLPVPRIDWTARDGVCPLANEGLCIHTNTTPVTMETGFINSNAHLGVNVKEDDSIEYRKVATCSPIQGNHSSVGEGGLGRQYQFYYGRNSLFQSQETFNYSLVYGALVNNYRIMTYSYDPENSNPIWRPNTTTMFDRKKSSASIFFLQTDYMSYLEPVYDMWFLTEPEPDVNATASADVRIWLPFVPVRLLFCEESHWFCKPGGRSGRTCIQATLGANISAVSRSLRLNARQDATLSRLAVSLLSTDLSSVAFMHSQPIMASKTALGGTQYAHIPDDQWRAEIGRWFSISLALIQASFIEFATGPADPSLTQYLTKVPTEEAMDDCRNQLARNLPGVRNFRLLAIVVVVCLGCGIILLGLVVDKAVGFAQRKLRRGFVHLMCWQLDGIFQLQRLAFEGVGVGGWKQTNSNVPITERPTLPRILNRDDAEAHGRQAAALVSKAERKVLLGNREASPA